MPTFDVFLLRHGPTDWNDSGRLMGRTDVGLNARGRAQAQALATALQELPVHAVLASPQRRAQETAAAVAFPHGLAVHTDPGLDEVWLGRWQGKTYAELAGDPDVERYFQDATYVCDAIEPATDVRDRVVAVVERLRAQGSEQSVALVSHGDPLRILLAHYLSMDLRRYRRLTVATASLSVLRFGAHRHRVLVVNWRPGEHALTEILSG